MGIRDTTAYKLIAESYGDNVAKRSQVPLINHIDQGIIILEAINASLDAQKGYCLHPLLQNDIDLSYNYKNVCIRMRDEVFPIMLAMEYRYTANAYLSDKIVNGSYSVADYKRIRLSVIPEVNQMLIADKVQNRKDFEIYHKGTHARSLELDIYFKQWLEALSISETQYKELCQLCN